jgi:hypothetical protein
MRVGESGYIPTSEPIRLAWPFSRNSGRESDVWEKAGNARRTTRAAQTNKRIGRV